jgi:hypothetical protein
LRRWSVCRQTRKEHHPEKSVEHPFEKMRDVDFEGVTRVVEEISASR